MRGGWLFLGLALAVAAQWGDWGLEIVAAEVGRFPEVTLRVQVQGVAPEELEGRLEVWEGEYQRPAHSVELGESAGEWVVRYSSGYDCDGASHPVTVRATLEGGAMEGSFSIGPLPVNPGCNPITPLPPTPVPTPSLTPSPSNGDGDNTWLWALGGLVLLLALGGLVWWLVAGRPGDTRRYCRQCSAWLPQGQKTCPYCGNKRTFQGP